MALRQEPLAHIKIFLVFTYIWQENIAKFPKYQGSNTMEIRAGL